MTVKEKKSAVQSYAIKVMKGISFFKKGGLNVCLYNCQKIFTILSFLSCVKILLSWFFFSGSTLSYLQVFYISKHTTESEWSNRRSEWEFNCFSKCYSHYIPCCSLFSSLKNYKGFKGLKSERKNKIQGNKFFSHLLRFPFIAECSLLLA